jgi:hypothetical protein
MSAPFPTPRAAALALLNSDADLNRRTCQFLGTLCAPDEGLSERQERWLSDLLRKHSLPPLAGGAGSGS